MKFQKSLLKIYELLLLNLERGIILEELIKKAKVGRTIGFKAVNELIGLGIAKEEFKGKQREIFLRLDGQSLGFKAFLDSFRFKELDKNIKLVSSLFVEYFIGLSEIKSLLLFGSCIENGKYNDLDFLIIHEKGLNKKIVSEFRNKLELVSDKEVNIHFAENLEINRFSNSLCVYGFEYCLSLIVKNKAKQSYLEALNWLDSYLRNKSNFENVEINLAFAYSYYYNLFPKTKEEAKSLLSKKYSINKGNIKEVMRKIGEEIFR